jgi:hypothetical protein
VNGVLAPNHGSDPDAPWSWSLDGRPLADGERLFLKMADGTLLEGSFVDHLSGGPWLRMRLPVWALKTGGQMAHAAISLPAGCYLQRG